MCCENKNKVLKLVILFFLLALQNITISNASEDHPNLLNIELNKLSSTKKIIIYQPIGVFGRPYDEKDMKSTSCVYQTEDATKIMEFVEIFKTINIRENIEPKNKRVPGPNELTEEERSWLGRGIYFALQDNTEIKFMMGGYVHMFTGSNSKGIKFQYDVIGTQWAKDLISLIYDFGPVTVIDPTKVTVSKCQSYMRRQLYEGKGY